MTESPVGEAEPPPSPPMPVDVVEPAVVVAESDVVKTVVDTMLRRSEPAAPGSDTDLHDTYFALLETPSLRDIELSKYALRHRTPAFSPTVYAAAAGIDFSDDTDAYLHWLGTGRAQGLE